jgi:hypothetical protein
MPDSAHAHTHTHTHTHTHIYIYIYIEREREREKGEIALSGSRLFGHFVRQEQITFSSGRFLKLTEINEMANSLVR